jgi:hypothetical protein
VLRADGGLDMAFGRQLGPLAQHGLAVIRMYDADRCSANQLDRGIAEHMLV